MSFSRESPNSLLWENAQIRNIQPEGKMAEGLPTKGVFFFFFQNISITYIMITPAHQSKINQIRSSGKCDCLTS